MSLTPSSSITLTSSRVYSFSIWRRFAVLGQTVEGGRSSVGTNCEGFWIFLFFSDPILQTSWSSCSSSTCRHFFFFLAQSAHLLAAVGRTICQSSIDESRRSNSNGGIISIDHHHLQQQQQQEAAGCRRMKKNTARKIINEEEEERTANFKLHKPQKTAKTWAKIYYFC